MDINSPLIQRDPLYHRVDWWFIAILLASAGLAGFGVVAVWSVIASVWDFAARELS